MFYFNIFIKNNLRYFITPVYESNIANYNEITIQHDNCNLSVKETIRKVKYEVTQIIMHDLSFSIQKTYNICVMYKDKQNRYTLPNTVHKETKQLTENGDLCQELRLVPPAWEAFPVVQFTH